MKRSIVRLLLALVALLLIVATAYACGHQSEPVSEPQAVVRKAGW